MLVHIFIEISGKIDSRKLYELIEQDGINLTDMGDTVLVYGDCYALQASQIVYNCALFGEVKATITH